MKKVLYSAWAGVLVLATAHSAQSQSREQQLTTIAQLVKEEGEVFVAIDQFNVRLNRTCTLEDYFSNQITFGRDSATIRFLNHTESACETTQLHSEADFRFSLQDVDPVRLVLVKKKYDLGKRKLSDGQDSWFEIHFFTRQNRALISRKDVASGEKELSNTVRLLFKSGDGARKTLSALREVLGVATTN
ncbi:MAG: hypothetical protein H7Z75_15700 [Ferruginibacter sp.]|nr:hypothetical protein [Cytophagales bacterium]